jgi:ABC-type transport system involved in multi-copper enzyme maturation permease subunit
MNPVFRKDILALLRLARIAAVLIAFVIVLSVLVLATWPQQGLVALAAQGQDNLLLGLIMGQLLVLILAVPGVAAVQLTEEREGNTLEMLYATRLSPVSIVLGKLMSAIGFPLLLLLSGLPFLALLNFRGDVDQASLAEAYGVLVAAAMMLALVSLAVSALCKTSATALVVAYLLVLTICGAVLVPAFIMLDVQEGPAAMGLHYLRSISPVAATMSILRPAVNDFGGSARGNLPAWQVFFGFALLAIAVSAALVASKLSKPPVDAEAAGPQSDEARSLGRKLMFLIDDNKQRKPIGSFNPVVAKERRTNQLRGGRWMIRIFYGSTVLALGLSLMALYGGSENENVLVYIITVIVALQFGIIALVTPSLASPVISTEREAGTFEMLRMTRLGGGKIFWGKFIPALLPALLPMVAIVPAWVVISFVNDHYIQYAVSIIPITLLALLMCSTVAMACSAMSATSARATVLAYMIVAAIFILPMLAWWTAGSILAPRLAGWVAMISPLAVALDLRPGAEASAITRQYMVPHLITIGGICLVALLVARVRLWQLMRQG